ncbi:hypothetical protein [Cognaticolwellia mytili]|uniref:hypothetical protein n=1 Tax=Cognaticolwellia mytili TaxID=1888913 RepID=UPI000A173B73|nr:hypothetical protein [Cognaticolwellia mytili]
MNVNLTRYFLTFTYITLFTLTPLISSATEAESFIDKLKMHYQNAPKLKVFSLNYHYLGASPYQGWDYQLPERYMALRMVEIDLIKKHFVENDIHHFPDGMTFNRVQFQNDKESLFYDKNGLTLGKRIIKQSMDSFEEIKGHIFMNIDFLAVKPLLEESNVAVTIKLHHDVLSGVITLTHRISDCTVIDYVFNVSSLRLLSINNKSQQKIYVYDDYQTTKGITFARSITKYYDGATTPSFIHRIDQLNIIEEIETSRFQVPKEFGPIIPESDSSLVSKEIAQNLYLVSDVGAWRNSLFKVNGDEITIFGGSVNIELAEKTLKLIRDQFPNKSINSIYVTHPHSDHIDGLPVYVKQGVTILADAYSIAAIKAYPPFAKDIAAFNFQSIEHNQTIDDAQFYVLESTHAKRQSFVHFKNSSIIYQADFLDAAFDNTTAQIVPNYTKTFIDFIRNRALKFNRMVGHHRNNNISSALVNNIYNATM